MSDEKIAAAIRQLCRARGLGKTICPSEVARLLVPDEGGWRALMPVVRRVAGDMALRGEIVVSQRGSTVDVARVRGAIRLSLPATARMGTARPMRAASPLN